MKEAREGNARLRGLPPVIGPEARALVLGSFPSAASIAAACYYAHPRNQFWPILSTAWKEAYPADLRRRSAWALGHGVAIWDSLSACVRPGSLDGDIRDAQPNDIAGLLRAWPAVSRVLVNGSAAGRWLRAAMAGAGAEIALHDANRRSGTVLLGAGRSLGLFFLPSTSPVPSREFRRIEDKLPLWLEALGRLSP
jgi:hypoxanthine-DNA glycosylase